LADVIVERTLSKILIVDDDEESPRRLPGCCV